MKRNLGPYKIKTVKGKVFSEMEITNVAGNWKIVLREDMNTYQMINRLLEDNVCDEYVQSYIAMMWILTTNMPDTEFMQEFFKCANALIERNAETIKENEIELTEEENFEIVREIEKAKNKKASK